MKKLHPKSARPKLTDPNSSSIKLTDTQLMKQLASTAPQSKVEAPRGGSKLAEVIALLSRKGGANMGDLISATGWLPHTTRAALTVLRKRGYGVERTRPEKGKASIYRILRAPARSLVA